MHHRDTVRKEQEEMKRCPYCNSTNTRFVKQALLIDEKGDRFDRLEYECLDCKRNYDKEFKLPEAYWKGIRALVVPPPSEEEVSEKYEQMKPLYEQLVSEVLFILRRSIEKKKIKIHNLTARVKTFKSLYNKILSRDIRNDPFKVINDIAGVRIICLYRSDLESIGQIISNNFDVITADTTRTRSEMHFGYMSDHFIVKLPQNLKGPRYDEIKKLKCEIQVRTILMDAWASVSHHLDYKKQIDVPSDLRKDFNALSGLFYVADTHFELFKEEHDKGMAQLMKSVRLDKFDLDQEMNLDTLTAYLRWKFPERPRSTVIQYSELLSELFQSGYEKINILDETLNPSLPGAISLEKEDKGGRFYSDIGITRICLDLIDKSYRKKREVSMSDYYWQLLKKYEDTLENDS